MNADMEAAADQVVGLITTYGLSIVGAIVILIVGWMVAGWASNATGKALAKSDRIDETLARFFTSIVRYLVLALTVLAVLSQFGVQTASLITVLGAAGLAVGLALQGTLSNVAAGVMLLMFRPFKIGDFVEVAGHAGTVRAITLFTTEMASGDNVHIVVPNASVWGSAVKNYSHHATRRIDLVVGISYGDDIDKAIAAINSEIEAEARALKEPESLIAVTELADSSVNLVVRVWVNAGDYWPTRFALIKAFKERLDREGVSIPFPQRDVHIINEAASS